MSDSVSDLTSDTIAPSTFPHFPFVLPKGLVDDSGEVHRQGIMRLATAKDELTIAGDRRVQTNPGYEILVRLARVVVQLGSASAVTPELLENLFALDLAYLQEFYNRINQQGNPYLLARCPQCRLEFPIDLSQSGESLATP